MSGKYSKLTKDDVDLIRALWDEKQRLMAESSKITLRGLAEKFGCSRRLIEGVVYYQKWVNPK